MSEPNTIITGSTMWVPLTGARNRDFARRSFEIDRSHHIGVPVWIIYLEVAWVEFHRSCREPGRDLGATFQTGTAPTAESFILDHDTAGIEFISLPDTINAGIHASSAMNTMFFIDANTVSWKGITLLADLLVETRSHDVQKPVEFRTVLHFTNEILHLLDREVLGIAKYFSRPSKSERCFRWTWQSSSQRPQRRQK